MGLKEDLMKLIPEDKHNEIDVIIEKNSEKTKEKTKEKTNEKTKEKTNEKVESIPIPPQPVKTLQEEQKPTKTMLQKIIDYL